MEEKKRDDLLKVLLIALDFQRKYSPWPEIYEGSEQRYRYFHSKATAKKILKGFEQAARELIHIAAEWPSEERITFYQKIRNATGVSFFAIVGDIEQDVEKILKRNKVRGEDDFRLLLDYVSDYPKGQYLEAARVLLRTLHP